MSVGVRNSGGECQAALLASLARQPMAGDTWRPDWRSDVLEWGLGLLLAPLWVPLRGIEGLCLWARTYPLVRGRVEDAWQRCAAVWRESGLVGQHAPYHPRIPLGHSLAVALARQHRRQKAFFFGKLLDPDPLLAAYAFKCLIRVCRLRSEQLPAAALDRSELIRVAGGRYVDEQPLGEFFKVYFVQQELLRGARAFAPPSPAD